jgi:para-nitrobenzyl esterase
MQGEMFGGPLISREETMAEDCLYLNVWAPTKSPDNPLPVLVVFHGGGFAAGSASEPRTDGEWFARQGIVVVAPNYRLGVFGFLAHPELTAESRGQRSGNYGMLDQVAALNWVRDNIAAFGGDPENVTINGESAGSLSVNALMASPLSRNLFHKAIGQSGAFFESPSGSMALKTLAEKEQDGVRFAQSVGAASLADLRARPADELLAAVMKAGGWGYSPGLDNHFLPQAVSAVYAAGEQAKIPLLAGWNSSELGMAVALNPEKPTIASFKAELAKQFGDNAAAAAVVYPASSDDEAMQSAADLASDLFISYSTWKWIEAHVETEQAPVYRYRFDRVLPGDPAGRFGALHAVEIEYAFNTLESKQSAWRSEDREIARLMATAFANFVKTGDPNGPGVPEWPEFGATGRVMYFDADVRGGPEEHRKRYDFLDAMMRN